MIHPRPGSPAWDVLALVVDYPGDISASDLGDLLDPYPEPPPLGPIEHRPGAWNARQEALRLRAEAREAHRSAAARVASRCLSALAQAGYVEPGTDLRLAPWARAMLDRGASVRDLLDAAAPPCLRETPDDGWDLDDEPEEDDEQHGAVVVFCRPSDLAPVEIAPASTLRDDILAALAVGARTRRELVAALGRGPRLSGQGERVLRDLDDLGIVRVAGRRWPTAKGVELVRSANMQAGLAGSRGAA